MNAGIFVAELCIIPENVSSREANQHGGIIMATIDFKDSIVRLREQLEKNGYSKSRIKQFNRTTNQLIEFMSINGVREYSMDVGLRFLDEKYGVKIEDSLSKTNRTRMLDLNMLSEFQLHGMYTVRHRNRNYHIPEPFRQVAEQFLEARRFAGIVERNMGTIGLYLERFFQYLTGQGVVMIEQINGPHIQGFLRYICGFRNQSKDHMMRTVRQFMEFCWKNQYHPDNLTSYAPNVHYEKRARIPSSYSYEEVMKMLGLVDRSNPVGKRNYAILLLITRLGLRAGDVSSLCFENFDWEHNRLTLTQHKTGRPLSLPLLEDVGLAVIDYLKYGRPDFDGNIVFLSQKLPAKPFHPSSLYRIVSGYIHKAGLTVPGKKRGPHSLRHSLASRLLEENVPLPVISEILGHATTETTAVYLTIGIDKLRRCALGV